MFLNVSEKQTQLTLCNAKTDWNLFKERLDDLVDRHVSLKSVDKIEFEVLKLIKTIQRAAWGATPEPHEHNLRIIHHSLYKKNSLDGSLEKVETN